MKQNGVSARVDYLRATTTDTWTIAHISEEFYRHDTTEPTVSFYGYKQALRELQTGAIALFNGHTATMGFCSQFSGKPITALMEATGQPSVLALRGVHQGTWRVRRIDIAIDVFDPALSPSSFLEARRTGLIKTCFRTWREVKDVDGKAGHTVYGGGLESEKQIRIYDKAAEQGIEGSWTRYEMVFNNNRADEVWSLIAQCNTDHELLDTARRLLGTLVTNPIWVQWIDAMVAGGRYVWEEIPRQESDTWRWLMSQVAPSFRKAWEDSGDWSLLERFVQHVKNG